MNIYVGNLPYTFSSEDLRKLFAPYGTVSSAEVLSDRDTGRSRGFGFVQMDNKDEAQKAIGELNGTDLDGRRLNINEARPRSERRPSSRPRW